MHGVKKQLRNKVFLLNRNVSSVGSEHCFDRAGVTGSSPVRSTMKYVLCLFLMFYASLINAQENYTVVYNTVYNVISFDRQRLSNEFDRQECLYTNGDSLSFYSHTYQKPKSKTSTIGSKKDHHSVYTFIKLERRLHQNAYVKPYCLLEFQANRFEWTILTDTLNIAGYQCKKAVAEGVTAWFAPDIKISGGPWSFYGLAGLILEVEDYIGKKYITAASVKTEAPRIVKPKLKLKKCNDCVSKIEEISKYFPD